MTIETVCGYHWVIKLLSQQKEKQLESCLNKILSRRLDKFFHYHLYLDKSLTGYENVTLLFSSEVALCEQWLIQGKILSYTQVCEYLARLDNHLVTHKSTDYEFLIIRHSAQVVGFLCLTLLPARLSQKEPLEEYTQVIHHLLSVYIKQLYTLQQARIDPLSQLLNRQTFEEKVTAVLHGYEAPQRRAESNQRKWYLALIDIDLFKRINDNFGHVIGDEVIVLVARLLKEQFRGEDYIFRYGGEEFAVLFPSVDDEHALLAVERIRETVAVTRFPQVNKVTISIGLVEAEGAPQVAELVNKADMALYHSKETGRNRTTAYSALGVKPTDQGHVDIELF